MKRNYKIIAIGLLAIFLLGIFLADSVAAASSQSRIAAKGPAVRNGSPAVYFKVYCADDKVLKYKIDSYHRGSKTRKTITGVTKIFYRNTYWTKYVSNPTKGTNYAFTYYTDHGTWTAAYQY